MFLLIVTKQVNTEKEIWLLYRPSIGVGARYIISLEKRINLSLDFAVGVDGNQGVYFDIIEAF